MAPYLAGLIKWYAPNQYNVNAPPVSEVVCIEPKDRKRLMSGDHGSSGDVRSSPSASDVSTHHYWQRGVGHASAAEYSKRPDGLHPKGCRASPAREIDAKEVGAIDVL